ncbi:hypothetical protein BSKO_01733 [Bryopsis sp. KO-2023]|nr:hypothetical protein BSKO_01733 [Bryopsis sp. KO-2023]
MVGDGGLHSSASQQLRILTLNCWGLWMASKKRKKRMRHIGAMLQKTSADVVLLQEVWVSSDAAFLMECAGESNLRHSHHFKSGIFGSGLITLSRFPIVRSKFWAYQVAGDPLKIHVGDYYASKGLGWCRLDTPWGELDVANTHLHANYNHKYDSLTDAHIPTDPFAPIRIAQILELSTMIHLLMSASQCSMVLGGDLNCRPDTLEFKMLLGLTPRSLKDAWSEANVRLPGCTCNEAGNSFSKKDGGDRPERIDYVLTTFPCLDAKVVLTRIPEEPSLSYSDHCGVRVVVDSSATGRAPRASEGIHPSHDLTHMLNAGMSIISGGIEASRNRLRTLQTLSIVMLVLSAILVYGMSSCGVCDWALAIWPSFPLVFALGFYVMGLMGEGPQCRALSESADSLQHLQGMLTRGKKASVI